MPCLLLAANACLAQEDQPTRDPILEARMRSLAKQVDNGRIAATMKFLSSPEIGSRVIGYPGSEKAAKYVEDQFRAAGITDVATETFQTSIPKDDGAFISSRAVNVRVYPLWPNMVRTSQVAKAGVDGKLIDIGRARLQDMRGKPLLGSIAIVDFSCGNNWVNAVRAGAKAIVFRASQDISRGEAEAKFMSIPVDVPRFWVTQADLGMLTAAIGTDVHLTCRMPWVKATGRNILAKIEGSDPKLKDQIIILSAYYDSMSVAPSLAPGAESTCSIAGLLELARIYKANPPKRTVWLLATDGHFLGLAGTRFWLDKHFEQFTRPGVGEKTGVWIANRRAFVWAVTGLLLIIGGFLVVTSIRKGKKREGDAAPDWRWTGATLAGIGVLLALLINATGDTKTVRARDDVYLFCGLDLSSNSQGTGLFYKGYYYDFREDIKGRFSDLATVARDNAAIASKVLGRNPDQAFADGVNDIAGKNWRNYIPGKMAFDAEAVTVGGGTGVTFATINDSRARVDTPYDTFDQTNPANVATQVRMIACLVDRFLQAPTQTGRMSATTFPIRDPNAFQRIGIQGGFATVAGQVVEFDPKKSFVPNQPVGDSVTILRSIHKSFMGVRANLVEVTDGKGNFTFCGVAPVTAYGGIHPTGLASYRLDKDTGGIKYAPDQGVFGGEFNYTAFDIATSSKEMPVVVFPCVATNIFDLVDPQSLRALGGLTVLDGSTNGPPRTYGTSVATTEPMVSHVEDGAVIFTPGMVKGPSEKDSSESSGKSIPYRIKLKMDAGPAATRLLLLNAQGPLVMPEGKLRTSEDAEGKGYPVYNGITLTQTAYKAARDMYILDDFRISRLAKYRIINQGLNKLHAMAGQELALADKALAAKNFEAFESHSRSAWGFEARAYPDVQATASDVVKGVLFYLALLLPFSFFLERLFFGWPDLNKQLATFVLIFVGVALGFSRIHPAFEITLNPFIVILAFIMLTLSLMVIVLVAGKFEEQLRKLNKEVSGVHRVDLGRMSVAAAAFSLGVSNMRRRKARTILTCVSLILVTFIVLSFTSIVNEIRFNARPTATKPTYNGIMLRTPMWEPLQETAYRILNDEFGRTRPVSARAWFMGTAPGEQSSLTVANGAKTFDAKAALGLSAEEMQITHPEKSLLAGRWFKDNELRSIILPKRMAAELGVKIADVGKAKVQFAGVTYTVIGILDSEKFSNSKDLDGEPLTPVDFILMNKQQGQAKSMGEAGFREYTHMNPDTVFVVPYRTLIDMGGQIYSIGINFVSAEEVRAKLDSLMPRLGLNLYAGKGDITYRYSSIGGSSTKGFASILIPIIIAGLSVLKTMLDSVYERVREIGIFSSIGLSPNHIAILFFAEATVYGILGAVSGYLIGQAVSKVLAETGWLAGLTLNFSSMSAVMSTMLVMAIVWLSTLYPARKASEVATPSIDRSWKVPEPDGDTWKISLPFSVTGEQASGVNSFLAEWFQAYEEYSVGDFVTQDVKTDTFENEYGKAYGLSTKTWLAPFDLGVSQMVRLETLPTVMEDVYEIYVTLERDSGDITNWKRVNRRFLNTLRKQFLIWRTLRAEDRDRYFTAADVAAGDGTTAGVVPAGEPA
ncbi:MAG: FtsX-like permease family protein [Armatimonadota bacterium]